MIQFLHELNILDWLSVAVAFMIACLEAWDAASHR
jgi:hypothetical protein